MRQPIRNPRPRNSKQTAFALDHDPCRLFKCGCDQSDAQIALLARLSGDPFGPGAGLAISPARHDNPCPPFASGRTLPVMPPALPVMIDRMRRLAPQRSDQRGYFILAQFAG